MSDPDPTNAGLRQERDALRARLAEYERLEVERQGVAAQQRALLDNLSQCVFVKDRNLCFLAVNPPFCQLLGRSEAEIVGKSDFDFFPSDLAAKYRRDDQAVLRRGERLELQEQNRVGEQLRTVRVVKAPIRSDTGEAIGVLGIFWDVAAEHTFQDQTRRIQTMEAVARLAGGVAHDFNNLLTIINGYSDLVLETLSHEDERRGQLEQVRRAGQRAADLTRQLLAFGRQQLVQPRPLDLNAAIRQVEPLVRPLSGSTIQFHLDLAVDLPRVQMDPSQVEQVLTNLVLNARDAMPGGGRLTIQTRRTRIEGADLERFPDLTPGSFVELSVRDTGVGISADVKAHLFEPFFTTKAIGKGSGLGLAMVYGIVKQNGGHITVESESGRGATFTLYFPEAANSVPDAPVMTPDWPQASETILLVEDEAMLRAMARHILLRSGYTVLEAADATEALAISQRHGGPIHLLLTDVVMPHLSGPQLAQELLRQRPDVKVLYISGYTDGALSAHGVPLEEKRFLQKPFTATALVRKLREVLDQ